MHQYFEEYLLEFSRVSTGRTITETDIVMHAGQTGDFYPHHMDAEWCKTQEFGARVAHGTLILSVAVGMLAGEINEAAFSYGYDRVRFIAPVFIGDTITSSATISAKKDHHKKPDEYGVVEEQVTVMNQHGDAVIAFIHIYMVRKKK